MVHDPLHTAAVSTGTKLSFGSVEPSRGASAAASCGTRIASLLLVKSLVTTAMVTSLRFQERHRQMTPEEKRQFEQDLARLPEGVGTMIFLNQHHANYAADQTDLVLAIFARPTPAATLPFFQLRRQVFQGGVFAQATDDRDALSLRTSQERPLGRRIVDSPAAVAPAAARFATSALPTAWRSICSCVPPG